MLHPELTEAATAPARPLGTLRGAVAVRAGMRLGYLTDLADTPANRAAAVALSLVAGARDAGRASWEHAARSRLDAAEALLHLPR